MELGTFVLAAFAIIRVWRTVWHLAKNTRAVALASQLDWDMEVRLSHKRNKLTKEKLLAGETVCYRSSGSSLKPRVKSGDQCTFIPVTKESQVEVNDIVFCEVQPRDRFYGHVVKKKEFWWSSWCYYFTISNLRGRENGWCYIQHIYGKLIEDDWCKMEHMVQDGEE